MRYMKYMYSTYVCVLYICTYDAHMYVIYKQCVYMKFYPVILTIQFKFRTVVCLPSRTSGVLGKSPFHLVTKQNKGVCL